VFRVRSINEKNKTRTPREKRQRYKHQYAIKEVKTYAEEHFVTGLIISNQELKDIY
jgi:hypothetical protein